MDKKIRSDRLVSVCGMLVRVREGMGSASNSTGFIATIHFRDIGVVFFVPSSFILHSIVICASQKRKCPCHEPQQQCYLVHTLLWVQILLDLGKAFCL